MDALTGHSFAQLVRSGAYAVVRSQDVLDRINVFPVADADTGANLVATLGAAAAGLGRTPPVAVGAAARMAADAALVGARGNSGAIFAQFLEGLAQGLHLKKDATTGDFAVAASAGVRSAYLAIQDPREGTILSVLKAWAAEMTAHAAAVGDFRDLMGRALDAARVALAATPAQLEVLARHRVVDAGGQGLVYFLEGMLDTLLSRTAGDSATLEALTFPAAYRRLAGPSGSSARGFVAGGPGGAQRTWPSELDERFRYCAEGLLSGAHLEREAIRRAVGHLGESLVIAGGDNHARVHLHTNYPDLLRAALEELGPVESYKVDDMVDQQAAARTATIALVTDSTFDLPEAAQLRFGTVMVPLTISLGGESFLDRVDLSSTEFYRRVRLSNELPRSSQPNRMDFRRAYEALLEDHEAVVSVHLSARLSGTYQSAAARGIRVYGATPSLDFAVKGGRVDARVARLAGLVKLRPVVLFDEEGGAHADGGHLGYYRAIRGIARRAARFAEGRPARVAITHADAPAAAAYLLEQLHRRFGSQLDIPMMESGAVLATHTGLGAVAVAARRLPDEPSVHRRAV